MASSKKRRATVHGAQFNTLVEINWSASGLQE